MKNKTKSIIVMFMLILMVVESGCSIGKKTCDCDLTEDSGSVRGIYYEDYSGESTAEITITNQSSARFENVTLTLCIYTYGTYSHYDEDVCGWEFTRGSRTEGSGPTAKTYKTIEVDLPYDGDWNTTEQLELVLYTQWSDLVITPVLHNVYVEVVDVSGTVIEQ